MIFMECVTINRLPVMKSVLLAAALGGALGLAFGILLGMTTAIASLGLGAAGSAAAGIAAIIILPIIGAMAGGLGGALAAGVETAAGNFGMKIAGGYRFWVDSEKGKVILRRVEAKPAAIIALSLSAPLILAYGLLVLLAAAVGGASGIAAGIVVFVLVAVLGSIAILAIAAAVVALGNVAYSLAGGYPILFERNADGVSLRSVSLKSSTIIAGLQALAIGIILALVIAPFAGSAATLISSGNAPGGAGGAEAALIGGIAALGIVIVAVLPIAFLVYGAISGLFAGLALNLGWGAVKGYEVRAEAEKGTLTLRGVDPAKSALAFAIIETVGDLPREALNLVFGLGKPVEALAAFVLGLALYVLIGAMLGGVGGVALNFALARLKGYGVEGSGLDLLFGKKK